MKLEDRFTVYKRNDPMTRQELSTVYDNLRGCVVTEQEAEEIINREYRQEVKKVKEKIVEAQYKILDCVPYQCCPVCNGTGQELAPGFTSAMYNTCTVCNGEKIIPMHVMEQINMEAPKN